MLVVMGFGEKEPQMNADERRLISSAHRKGRNDLKASQQSLHFCIKKHPRNSTRIARIFTDNRIRGHPRHPRNPCSIGFALESKSGAIVLDAGLGD